MKPSSDHSHCYPNMPVPFTFFVSSSSHAWCESDLLAKKKKKKSSGIMLREVTQDSKRGCLCHTREEVAPQRRTWAIAAEAGRRMLLRRPPQMKCEVTRKAQVSLHLVTILPL